MQQGESGSFAGHSDRMISAHLPPARCEHVTYSTVAGASWHGRQHTGEYFTSSMNKFESYIKLFIFSISYFVIEKKCYDKRFVKGILLVLLFDEDPLSRFYQLDEDSLSRFYQSWTI